MAVAAPRGGRAHHCTDHSVPAVTGVLAAQALALAVAEAEAEAEAE